MSTLWYSCIYVFSGCHRNNIINIRKALTWEAKKKKINKKSLMNVTLLKLNKHELLNVMSFRIGNGEIKSWNIQCVSFALSHMTI
jgi:hypothetical protein